MKNKADIAVAGLAVMGENLVLNMESKGFTVAVYNRTYARTEAFANGRGKGKNILPASTVAELCDRLASSTAATAFSKTPCAALRNWEKRKFCMSEPESPAARRARCTDLP